MLNLRLLNSTLHRTPRAVREGRRLTLRSSRRATAFGLRTRLSSNVSWHMSRRASVVALMWTILCAACYALDSHQNFTNHMSRQVGMNADDKESFTDRYRELRVSSANLSNGNIEEKYRAGTWRGAEQCHVFFEINPKSFDWRYEGTRDVCRIPL
jgi:hypothetical protein